MFLYEEMRKPRLSAAEREMKLENFEVLFTAFFKSVGNCGTQVSGFFLAIMVDKLV